MNTIFTPGKQIARKWAARLVCPRIFNRKRFASGRGKAHCESVCRPPFAKTLEGWGTHCVAVLMPIKT